MKIKALEQFYFLEAGETKKLVNLLEKWLNLKPWGFYHKNMNEKVINQKDNNLGGVSYDLGGTRVSFFDRKDQGTNSSTRVHGSTGAIRLVVPSEKDVDTCIKKAKDLDIEVMLDPAVRNFVANEGNNYIGVIKDHFNQWWHIVAKKN